jgi:hypothetical protein
MTVPPDDTRRTRINRMLREIGRIGQEIKREETEQDAERRAILTVWCRPRVQGTVRRDPLPEDAQVLTRRATPARW